MAQTEAARSGAPVWISDLERRGFDPNAIASSLFCSGDADDQKHRCVDFDNTLSGWLNVFSKIGVEDAEDDGCPESLADYRRELGPDFQCRDRKAPEGVLNVVVLHREGALSDTLSDLNRNR